MPRHAIRALAAALVLLPLHTGAALAQAPATGNARHVLTLLGIPVDFILFALTLLGVALFHHHTLKVALTGLAVITLYQLLFTGFAHGAGLAGLGTHLTHEWVILANLLGLLLGGARRQLDLHHQHALVFLGQKGRGQAPEQQAHGHEHHGIDGQAQPAVAHHP